MAILKKTVTTIETTVPGDRLGCWVTTTTQTIEVEETLGADERPSFGVIAKPATGERELPPL